jgi:copper chaperone CopZ
VLSPKTIDAMQTLSITGMTCGNCVAKVQKRLAEHPSITVAKVTLTPPLAEIESTQMFSNTELNAWLASIGHYQFSNNAPPSLPEKSATTYRPLLIILGYLLAVTASTLVASGHWDAMLAMRIFMGGFFITFSFFKLLDLRGFSDAYRSYDIIAKVWPGYGFIYPFIELSLGLAYLANFSPLVVNVITASVMAISFVGVLRAVISKKSIRCACLGTVFQLPMSTVTLIEDGLMLAMATGMVFLNC